MHFFTFSGERRLSSKDTSMVTSNAFTTTTAVRESTYIPLNRSNLSGDGKSTLKGVKSIDNSSINREMESPLLRQMTNMSEV